MQSLKTLKRLAESGLWSNNQALVALLGLCPLLAVSNTVVNSLGLGLATTFALVLSNGLVSSLRNLIPHDVRLPLFVLVIASVVTAIDLTMHAWFFDLYRTLGLFIPLIVTNCVIIGRVESFASRQPVHLALLDGLFMGLGFTLALLLLGALRELIGTGKLFSGAQNLFGSQAAQWTITVFPNYEGFLLAILPPGAFMGLGLVIVAKNLVDQRRRRKASLAKAAPITEG
jgi:electron transport complex protein RnfE